MNRIAILIVLSTTACAVEEQGPTIFSGIDADKQLSALSFDEKHHLCRTALSGMLEQTHPERFCEMEAAISTGDTKSCKTQRRACIDGLYTQDEVLDLGHCEEDFLPLGCTATVGEYEACLNTVLTRWSAAYAPITCGAAGEHDSVADPEAIKAAAMKQPACAALQARCAIR